MRWPQAPLRRICRIENGGTPTGDEENWNGDILWATPVDLGEFNGRPLESTQRRITKEGLRTGSGSVPSRSLVVSTRAPIGYVSQSVEKTAFNQGCRGLVPSADVDVRYLRYQLVALGSELESRGSGSTFMEVSSGGLAEVVVSLPRLDDQRNIGDHLDGEVGRLTELIQLRRVQVDSLRELERSRVDSVLAAQGDVSLVRLGYLSIVQSGVTVDAGRRVDTTFVRRPYLRVANVQNGHIDLTEVSSIMVSPRIAFEGRLRFGDVLMTEGGDLDKLGRGAVWRGQIDDCLHQNHVFAVRANRESLNPDYLATVTRSSLAREYFERTGNKTTNLASTSSSKIKDFRVPLPDLEVQRASVRQIDVHSAEIQAARAALGRQIELLEERRHALIVAAVTGQVDVTTARGADV